MTNRPHCGCTLCGEVFQSDLDRAVPPGHTPNNSVIALHAWERRQRWRANHECASQTKRTNAFASPEAAQRLSYYGIFSLIDLVTDDEIAQALKEA